MGADETKTVTGAPAAALTPLQAGPSGSPERPDRIGVTDRSVGRLGRAIRFLKTRGLREVAGLVRTHGLSQSLRFVGRNIRAMIAARADRKFDRVHAVDTAGTIPLEFMTVIGPNRAHGNEYISTSPKSFAWMMEHISADPNGYCFIDFGAGKGRTLLLAAQRPFDSLIGVEFATDLAATARSNLQSYRGTLRAAHREIVETDAASFGFPERPLVLYFYNPFGPEVMGPLLKNLALSLQQNPRDCWVVYASSYPETLVWARPLILETRIFEEIDTRAMPFYLDAARSLDFAVFRRRP